MNLTCNQIDNVGNREDELAGLYAESDGGLALTRQAFLHTVVGNINSRCDAISFTGGRMRPLIRCLALAKFVAFFSSESRRTGIIFCAVFSSLLVSRGAFFSAYFRAEDMFIRTTVRFFAAFPRLPFLLSPVNTLVLVSAPIDF